MFVGLNAAHRRVLFEHAAWDLLTSVAEVETIADDEARLPAGLAADYDVLVTGWDVPRLERVDGDRLKLVVHSAGSFRGVLAPEVLDSDVVVSQAGSDPMARAVAEFALTLTLSILREVYTYDRGLQTSRDYAASRMPEYGTAIYGIRHGLIGLSRVGVWHARMLRGLGSEDVVAYDPYFPAERANELGVRLVPLAEAMSAGAVAVHLPVTDETRGMIGRAELALMPDGGVLVNTARAAVVDMPALEAELLSGRIRAGLDVFDEEPLPASSALYGLPNVLLAPHVAGATAEARFRQGDAVVSEIRRFANGEPLAHRVSLETVARLS